MKTSTKFLLGGLGALVPILMNLLVIDLETQMVNVKVLAVCSYFLRTLALFVVGGLVVTVFNRDEQVPAKLFQLGIFAPALLTAFINGKNVSVPTPPKLDASASSVVNISQMPKNRPSLFAIAHAGTRDDDDVSIKSFSLADETPTQQVLRGLLGRAPDNIWFVITGSQRTQEDAVREARSLRTKGFEANVYVPYGGNPWWGVVIGEQMTLPEARALRSRAVSQGLSNDTYLWTFPGQR